MAYPDTFQRADGPLGSGWTVAAGAVAISGGNVVSSSLAEVVAAGQSESGDQDHSIVVPILGGSSPDVRVMLKYNAPTHEHYYARVRQGSGYLIVTTGYLYGGQYDDFDPVQVAMPGGSSFILRGVFASGVTRAYINGALASSHSDNDWAARTGFGFGFQAAGGQVNGFDTDDAPEQTMTVTPDPIWIGGGPQQMLATGSGTDWTVGVPGSSTITVNNGVVLYQFTLDATHIRFTYEPIPMIGPLIFTESQYGLTDEVAYSLTPPDNFPLGFGLSAEAIAYIERSAVAEANATIANRQMLIGGGGYETSLTGAIEDVRSSVDSNDYAVDGQPGVNHVASLLWAIINGTNAPPRAPLSTPSDTTLKEDADAVQASLAALITSNHWTLGDVITQVTGTGVPTIKDVLDALAELPGSDLSAVTSRLDAMRGDSTTSLATLLSSLAGIRTVDAYSLADVLDAIGDPAQATSPATAVAVVGLVAALALAAPTGGASVAAAAVAVGAGPVLDIATIVELVGLAGEIADLIATIAEIRANMTNTYQGAPVWPGASLVDLGTSASLGSRGTITEAMDGVVVDIDHADTDHKPAYSYDGSPAWRNIGCLAFADDAGRMEGYQPFCFGSQVFTPKSLRRAASVRWFTGHGPIGTIRAWTVKP